jgi:chromosomal replication initiator protein
MRIPEDVIEHIATLFTANVRELEGALIRAHAYSNMTGTELSVRSLHAILMPAGLSGPSSRNVVTITLDKIIESVAQHYNVEPSEVRSSKRSPDLALPRHIAMYIAHDLIQVSFPRIGQAFSNRKHTSAMYAHSRIKEAILKDPALAETINQITRKLQG